MLGIRFLQIQTSLIHSIVSLLPTDFEHLVVDAQLFAAGQRNQTNGLGGRCFFSSIKRDVELCELSISSNDKLSLAQFGRELFELSVRPRGVENLDIETNRGERQVGQRPVARRLTFVHCSSTSSSGTLPSALRRRGA